MHARLRALFLSPLKLMLQFVRHQKIMYLVAHATMNPPGPTHLSSEEDNQTENLITQIM
jgi:hypothetical protein